MPCVSETYDEAELTGCPFKTHMSVNIFTADISLFDLS